MDLHNCISRSRRIIQKSMSLINPVHPLPVETVVSLRINLQDDFMAGLGFFRYIINTFLCRAPVVQFPG